MKRTRYSAEFKAKVALEALAGDLTTSQLAARYGVHPNQITQWKAQARTGMAEVFSRGPEKTAKSHEQEIKELHAKIGQLTVERDFLAKGLRALSQARRKGMVEVDHPRLSIVRQCALLGTCRSAYYYQPKGESAASLALMRLIDAKYLQSPCFGARQMTRWLCRNGHSVGRRRVRRLMALMGLSAIYPKPRTTVPDQSHRIYPYLLRDLSIDRPNQVWCSDITFIPMRQGFMYLVAVMDWHSRKVLSWRLSNTMDAAFCVEALQEALVRYGRPEIFNTDQGCQFTSREFTSVLISAGVRISMDGKGRWMDNVFIERLWRTVKYECIHLHEFATGRDARTILGDWFEDYNSDRPHSSLEGLVPNEVYADNSLLGSIKLGDAA
ncbi:IS3 family transposase [Desulfonatronum thiosulfatophilum]